jgi:hypothetical protein
MAATSQSDQGHPEIRLTSDSGGYLFPALIGFFTVDLWALEPRFVLPLPASTVAIRVCALSISAASRALCDALRWLARRFISFALWAPRITSSIDRWRLTAERRS